jgi:hypothetical protein
MAVIFMAATSFSAASSQPSTVTVRSTSGIGIERR